MALATLSISVMLGREYRESMMSFETSDFLIDFNEDLMQCSSFMLLNECKRSQWLGNKHSYSWLILEMTALT